MARLMRRQWLAHTGALISGCAVDPYATLLGKRAEEQLLSQEYLRDLFYADAEPTLFLRPPRPVPRWHELPSKPLVEWAADLHSAEYWHLKAGFSPTPFSITAETLVSLASRNRFRLRRSETILFGLRGCELAQGGMFAGFSPQLLVRETVPDHQNFRCVLGVIRGEEIWAGNGSTVPNVDYMYQCWKGGVNSNLLPTGCHKYVVGAHNRGKPTTIQPGAFRQVQPVCVLRTKNDMCYRASEDEWDYSPQVIVSDNIHAAVLDRTGSTPRFSSAGCQTLPGSYDATRQIPLGVWAEFRRAAGLRSAPLFTDSIYATTSDDGREFSYMLLTGREARLVLRSESDLGRLRFGSTGDEVRALQRALLVPDTGSFDQPTMISVLKHQRGAGILQDGIVTQQLASSLGVTLAST